MKNVKISVLFLIIFVSFALFAQETPDSENPDSEVSDQDSETVDQDSEVADQDSETPDQEPEEPEEPEFENGKGQMIGGEPVMSWEDGGQDFFVMFNSNIDDKIKLYDDSNENPQGDSCVESSSFTLNNLHIPDDAIIEKAYLIWMGAVDPEKLDLPTDNEVHLAFTQTADSNVEHAADVKVGGKGKKLNTKPSFDFEGIRFKQESVRIGCSETSSGEEKTDFEIGYFTYRADVTDFFQQIYELNKTAGHQEGTGEYYGTYTFSGLDCTEHDAYRCNTTMISGWSIFFIYRSKNIRPKKIYFYNGLAHVYGQESVANVSGFELPLNPAVRLTTMIGEGDPSLTDPNLPPEGLFLNDTYRIKNKCNPITKTYVEVFNSVSSIVNWNPDAPEDEKIICVSGPNDEGVNYGIDVDTFLLDSEKEINLQEHLEKGNTEMAVKLSVNQDAIVTNFMVLSVDIKGSDFDIPDEDEKYSCSCPASDPKAKDYYCPYINRSKEFYYLVKVQNWGKDETKAVSIFDELDAQLDYVPGTTELATKFNSKGDGTDWTAIPDLDGGKFPLSAKKGGENTGFKLIDKMVPCTKTSCPDKILVRYKVRPKTGIAKNYVFSNIALIKDEKSEEPYKTNTSYPLKLKPMTCVSDSECDSPTPEMCGGVKDNKECGEGYPECPSGYLCDNGKCVDNPESMCSDAAATLALGKNTPQSENTIIIPKDNGGQPLVLGQFTLQAAGCDEGKMFNFNDIRVHFNTRNNSKFEFSDFELIYDKNGNGVYDEGDDGDIIVSNPDSTTKNANYIYMSLKANAKKYFGKSLNYFIIRAKVNYKDEAIPTNTAFNFYIEKDAVKISSSGNAEISEGNDGFEFATFYLEPTGDYFIVTSGPHDPAVPAISEMNNNIPVMQIKTKSIGKANSINKFKIKVPGNSVKFGEKNGITGISLWIDTNNDGTGDVKIAEKTKFASGESTAITFEEFSQPLSYIADEEKYLVVKADFNMVKSDPAMFGKISVPRAGIMLENTEAAVYELPLNSKSFTYECKEGDASCMEQKGGSKGGCSTVDVESDNSGIIVLAALLSAAAMLGFALLRKKIF